MDTQTPAGGLPGPTLRDVGNGRVAALWSRSAIIEQYDGAGWREVRRYRSLRAAQVALDEAIGAGAELRSLRVVELGPSTTARVLLIAGAAMFLAVFAFSMYVVFG